jgi:hypothetical protein
LKDNDEYIVVGTDKNFGGAALGRTVYNTKGVSEHLGNKAVYTRLTKKEATG